MRSRKRKNIYAEMAEHFGKTQPFIRKIAHHPFEFLREKVEDETDYSPVRLRYLGLFYVKSGWRKNMVKAVNEAPPEGVYIFARVPAKWRGRNRYFLQYGIIEGDKFHNDYGDYIDVSDIQYWKKMSEKELKERGL